MPKRPDLETSRAFSALAKARWRAIPKAQRSAMMSEAGKLGGRPRDENRCPCGAMTAKRAKARGHRCTAAD